MTKRIILTDYPKTKHIEAHYRGVETKKLVKWLKQLFHTMMVYSSEEAAGYVISYNYKDIQAELDYRGARPEGY